MLGLFLIGMLEVAATVLFRAAASEDPASLSGLWVLAPLLGVWFGLFHFFFRQKAVWGSPEGLEVGGGKSARRIQWSSVSQPEWTWFSFQAPAALGVAFVEIAGKGERIFFYANGECVTKLCRMRDAALTFGRSEHGPSDGPEPPARPTFPFAFIPVVVALVALASLLGAGLRMGHAVLGIGLVAVAVVVIVVVIVFAFSKPPRA
jgi:hypothetical protein